MVTSKEWCTAGSELGPTLFVFYIDDIDDNICSHILKFADDTKIFGLVGTEELISIPQQDLVQVFRWSQEWQMLFNETKCLHIGHRNQHHVYTIGDHNIEETVEERDLGVIITETLSPQSSHCQGSTEGQPDSWHDQKDIRGQMQE